MPLDRFIRQKHVTNVWNNADDFLLAIGIYENPVNQKLVTNIL
jgi:hypothetical protein